MKQLIIVLFFIIASILPAQASTPNEALIFIPTKDQSFYQEYISKIQTSIIRSSKLSNGMLYVADKDKVSSIPFPKKHYLSFSPQPSVQAQFEDNATYFLAQWTPQYPITIADSPSLLSTPTSSVVNDPLFPHQWALQNTGINTPTQPQRPPPGLGEAKIDLNAIKAWSITKGSKKIKIAIIDTGVDYNHPDLKENIWINLAEYNGTKGVDDDKNGYIDDINGYDFTANSASPMDIHGHGTHCAGIIGAVHNNNTGIVGIMEDVSIIPLKIFDNDGRTNAERAVRAIDYAIQIKVQIISASWGGYARSELLNDAIQRAAKNGILFITAAGNEANNNDMQIFYPAGYEVENIVSVAAHNHKNNLAWFSNYGPKSVLVSAPGQYILSTVPDNKYAIYSGTSMATPYVSGTLGLLLAKEGSLSFSEIKKRLIDSSIPNYVWRKKLTSQGRTDAYTLLTHQVIDRGEPKESDWKTHRLVRSFETAHPVAANSNIVQDFVVPKARYVRLVIKKYGIRKGLGDALHVRDGNDFTEFEHITGNGEIYRTDLIQGNKIGIRLATTSNASWGVIIDAIEYIE